MSVSAINVCHNHHLSPVILQKKKKEKGIIIWTTALRNRKQIKAPYSHCRPIMTAYNA